MRGPHLLNHVLVAVLLRYQIKGLQHEGVIGRVRASLEAGVAADTAKGGNQQESLLAAIRCSSRLQGRSVTFQSYND